MIRITNARIVTYDRVLEDRDLIIAGDRVAAIVGKAEALPAVLAEAAATRTVAHASSSAVGLLDRGAGTARNAIGTQGALEIEEVIDARNAYLMPGFVDIHADYIEHMAAPRPTAVMNPALGIREAERELITHGITTMFHSLSMYGNADFPSNPIRQPDNMRSLVDEIFKSHNGKHVLRHRFHARFEIDVLDRLVELEELIDDGRVHLLSFMDHTPGQGQYNNLALYRETIKGYRNISDEEVDRIIHESRNRTKVTAEALAALAARAIRKGVAVASHDDDSYEKLELAQGLGATISEFPITIEVARRARDMGMHTIGGAPNILLGGSHSGNLSAEKAILEGVIDILCSDYYPPSMLHAIFFMQRKHNLPLPGLVALLSANPAKAVGMDNDIGSIAVGKKADLLIVDQLDDGFPFVSAVIMDGKRLFELSYRQ